MTHNNYRQAAIVLSKTGFNPEQVLKMNHAELGSWLESILKSMGIKSSSTTTSQTLIPMRLKKSKDNVGENSQTEKSNTENSNP